MPAEYTYRISAWWTSGPTGLAKCESSPNASPPLIRSALPRPRNWPVCRVAGLRSSCCSAPWQAALQRPSMTLPAPRSSNTQTLRSKWKAACTVAGAQGAISPKF